MTYCDHKWTAIRWSCADGYRVCGRCGRRERRVDIEHAAWRRLVLDAARKGV